MVTETEIVPCSGEDCFETIEAPIVMLMGRRLNVNLLCDSCEQKAIERKKQDADCERRNRLKTAFDDICPPLYRESDLKRIYGPFREIAENWQFGPRGILLEGNAGTGKTRSAWHIIKRMMTEQGKNCYGLTATLFAKYAADQWHSNLEDKNAAIEAMDRCRSAVILLIDDLGKQKMTDRGETELYDVLEHRTTNLKPTIITTNATGDQLKKMISEDRRQPILRRISDFSDIIKFK